MSSRSAERRFWPWRLSRKSLTTLQQAALLVREPSPCFMPSINASFPEYKTGSPILPASQLLSSYLPSLSLSNKFTSEFSGVLLYIWATTGSVLHASWDLIIAVWNRWNGTYLITGSRICNFLTSARRGHMQGSNRVHECSRHLPTFVVLGVSTWSPIVFSPIIWAAWNVRMVS
jgi:hypothetical protein